jgi:threonine synthase
MRARVSTLADENPFIHFRWLLDSYRTAREAGWTDDQFVALVERLDDSIAQVDGRGFEVTPLAEAPSLGRALGRDRLWVKDETNNVSGSHKARHLFGVLLHLAIDARPEGELAIASCGNAALAAAVVAKAGNRPLRVFIPTWANPVVVAALERLGAAIEVCERRTGEEGDPAYLRFVEAVGGGSVPFSCQGTMTPSTLDGGRTIGWEIAEQLGLAGVEGNLHLFVQIGGGALASAAWMGITDGIREQWLSATPILHAVQTEACAPLARAWDRLHAASSDPDEMRNLMASDPDAFMQPWPAVGMSAASGILDDVTYDWQTIVDPMLSSGGWPVTVTEEMILEANRLARQHTRIDVDHTGSAGLAGLLDRSTLSRIDPSSPVVVLFTGVVRKADERPANEA